MDAVIQHVSESNKKWVSELTPKEIAQIFDAIALVPNIINNPIVKKQYTSELPANVGLQGEMKFESIIQKFLSCDYKLINTAKTGKCGDFIIKYSSNKTNQVYSILIDVKNYKTTVPSKEIEKFYRDIKLNSNIHGGILLSLHSKIVGITKIIDFQEFASDNGIVPVIFTKSHQPELICEIIKMIFHLIEIKDINKNELVHETELISTINELSDEVQLITQCRDNLQISKTLIEKNLNEIMFSLMKCEYNIANKIKQINKSLCKDIHIILPVSPTTSNDDTKNTELNHVISVFKNSIELEYETLLYSIYGVGWSENVIDIAKSKWVLYKENKLYPEHKPYMFIKFNKKSMNAVFPIQNDAFITELEINNNKSKEKCCKMKADGYHITINPNNINLIINLCKCI
jgi:hypothetical protein